MPLVSRTRATLRSAEFGFFGVVVYTRVHTPRRCGAATFFLRPLPDFRPGVESLVGFGVRPLRTSWLVVGMRRSMVAAGAVRAGRSSRCRRAPACACPRLPRPGLMSHEGHVPVARILRQSDQARGAGLQHDALA